MTWALAFLWTLALELPVAAFAARRRLRPAAFFLAFFVGNALTHRIVWVLVPRFETYATAFFTMEAFAVVAEGFVYAAARRIDAKTPPLRSLGFGLTVSLLANAFSAFFGPLLLDALAR